MRWRQSPGCSLVGDSTNLQSRGPWFLSPAPLQGRRLHQWRAVVDVIRGNINGEVLEDMSMVFQEILLCWRWIGFQEGTIFLRLDGMGDNRNENGSILS